jgi:hypothetical protein
VRMILDAPFVSARIDDIRYKSYTEEQDPIPGMSYWKDGGVSYRTGIN